MATQGKHTEKRGVNWRTDGELLAELIRVRRQVLRRLERCQYELDELKPRRRAIMRALHWLSGCVRRLARRVP